MEEHEWEFADSDASVDSVPEGLILELDPLTGYEPCGASFARTMRYLGEGFESMTPRTTEEDEDEKPAARPASAFEMLLKDSENLYALLGLEDLKYNASEEQIKTAYRKMVLKYHPDKTAATSSPRSGTDPMFLKISEAYKLLSDPEKRRGYDSQYEFDEWIPEDDEDVHGEEFFAVYAPVFESNARFSMRKPCPQLGDESTPLEEVKRFYDFWRDFQSWRDFSQFDEQDADDCENRYEKRWIQQENKRHRAKLKRKENQRLMTLVENAYRLDPRIQREREQSRLRRETLERERREMEAEFQASREANDQLRREEEEERKRVAVATKARCKGYRRDIALSYQAFASANPSEPNLSIALGEWVPELSEDGLRAWSEEVLSSGCARLQTQLKGLKQQKEEEMARIKARIDEMTSKPTKERSHQPWGESDDSFLSKAVKQIPRWVTISVYVTNNTGIERSPTDCLDRASFLKRNLLKQSMTESPAAVSAAAAAAKRGIEAAAAVASPTGALSGAETEDSRWSPEQQAQLEKSLDPKVRWEKIGAAVEGKTRKECIARFKTLKERIAKKGAP